MKTLTTPCCSSCGDELDREEKEHPRKDEDGDLLCDRCYQEKYEGVCDRCGEIVEKKELAMRPSELIAFWEEVDGLKPGYYRVLKWPIYMDGNREGGHYLDNVNMGSSIRITAVTGFSRSGTSLMMRMLDAGGIEPVAENKGSYEDTRCNDLPSNPGWVAECQGKACKFLSPEHFKPPAKYLYDWIWMRRNAPEQAKSQIKFLRYICQIPARPADWPKMAESIDTDTPCVQKKLESYPGARLLEVRFEEMLSAPLDVARQVQQFLGREMDVDAMAAVIIPRSSDCYPGFLELRFV